MNSIKRIFPAYGLLLPLLCVALLTSCFSDDEYTDDGETSGKATLQLTVMAREEGDLNTRAEAVIEGTEVGTTSEYMHNLCVLIVQDGVLKKKLLPDVEFLANPAAAAANVKAWRSEQFTLDAGTYTVYAFANIDTYYNTGWGSLTGLEEGESLTEKGINVESIVLDNPVYKLNFDEGYFIPMSAKKEETVTPSTTGISIGLDRLVSKVRLAISGKGGSKVTALSFGGYANKVALFEGGTLPDATNYDTLKVVTDLLPDDPTIPTTGSLTMKDFYVNCSPAEHPFNVSVTTDEMSGVTYEAVTSLYELPRNSIYPLTLQLNDYGLDLDATCTVAPMVSYPVAITPTTAENTYDITVPEGCEFTLTVNGVKTGSNNTESAANVGCTWAITSEIDGIEFYGTTVETTTITGHVSAEAGKTFPLSAQVTWTGGTAQYKRTYTINIITTGLEDFLDKIINGGTTTRSTTTFGLEYMRHEMLNMFKK